MSKPFSPGPFFSSKPGYRVAFVTALLAIVLVAGIVSHAPSAYAAPAHSPSPSLVHIHPNGLPAGGCQYGSEELIQACISAQGREVIGDAYINVRVSNCSMLIEIISPYSGYANGGWYACNNMTGWVGNEIFLGWYGDTFYTYAALYVNNSFWSSAVSPEILVD